jgi:hypothetical protein
MILTVLVFIVMLVINLPPLIKKRELKMLIIYGCIYTTALVLCILLTLEVKIPSPLVLADSLFKSLNLSY